MSKEMSELKEKVAELIYIGDSDFNREGEFIPNWDYALEQADQILSLETDKCRLAVVERDVKLPRCPISEHGFHKGVDGTTLYEITRSFVPWCIYCQARDHWLKAWQMLIDKGFVREVKE